MTDIDSKLKEKEVENGEKSPQSEDKLVVIKQK